MKYYPLHTPVSARRRLWRIKTTESRIDRFRHPGSVWHTVRGTYGGRIRVFYTRALKGFMGGAA